MIQTPPATRSSKTSRILIMCEKLAHKLAASKTPIATYAKQLIKANFAATEWDDLWAMDPLWSAARMERTCTKMCAQVLLHYNQASVAIPKDDETETRHTKKSNALGRISFPTLFAHITGISACRRRFWVHVSCKASIAIESRGGLLSSQCLLRNCTILWRCGRKTRCSKRRDIANPKAIYTDWLF